MNKQARSLFEDGDEITRRFRVAVREALLDHKRAGNPVAVWRDGKVVIVPPEEIDVSGIDAALAQAGYGSGEEGAVVQEGASNGPE